jgi:hypothetical protein
LPEISHCDTFFPKVTAAGQSQQFTGKPLAFRGRLFSLAGLAFKRLKDEEELSTDYADYTDRQKERALNTFVLRSTQGLSRGCLFLSQSV